MCTDTKLWLISGDNDRAESETMSTDRPIEEELAHWKYKGVKASLIILILSTSPKFESSHKATKANRDSKWKPLTHY